MIITFPNVIFRWHNARRGICGGIIISGNNNGLPNGTTFHTEERATTLCQDCIIELGRLKEAGDEEGARRYWQDLGVEVKG